MKLQAVLDDLQQRIETVSRAQEPLEHILLFGKPLHTQAVMWYLKPHRPGDFRFVTAANIERAGDMAAILTHLKHHDVLFIDDIHALSRAVAEVLYPAMHDFALDIVVGKGSAAKNVRLPVQRFTLVAATNRFNFMAGPSPWPFGIRYTIGE
jgi:Holliday junction DNA helicase RuvB